MSQNLQGLQHIRKRITIHAPAEICYQIWIDSPRIAKALRRLQNVQSRPINSLQDVQAKVELLHVGADTIKKWLFYGPEGKMYEVENIVVMDIPNRFYCTSSIDPNDLSFQSSMLFSPDELNQNTDIEVQISFWNSEKKGPMTQLVSDILDAEDHFFEDCLQDFKAEVESNI